MSITTSALQITNNLKALLQLRNKLTGHECVPPRPTSAASLSSVRVQSWKKELQKGGSVSGFFAWIARFLRKSHEFNTFHSQRFFQQRGGRSIDYRPPSVGLRAH